MKQWLFPICCVLGDTQGQDNLCGRFVYYGTQAGRIHCACDCPGTASSDPNWKCNFILENEVKALMELDSDTRKEFSQHLIDNAFHKVDFGKDPHGIHGCTPIDIMHVLKHGFYTYVADTFFSLVGQHVATVIDNVVIRLGRLPRCKGRANFPRVYFGKGITNLSRTTASENAGMMMMLLLACLTQEVREAVENCNRSKGFKEKPSEDVDEEK
jgi:hypothetical protein